MAAQPPALQEIKARMKAMWMAGDFGKIASLNEDWGWGQPFVERLALKPGMKVLDVGCGTGNQALRAARTGAEVTGADIATNLLEQARTRAKQEGLTIQFVEGDAEELPFPDASFDVVYSMFGAMFAPRPDRVASEFKRVCKSGGLIAMANWTPESVPGQLFRASAKFAPPPPGMQPPALWGVEPVVRERFGGDVEIQAEKRVETARFQQSPAEVAKFFVRWFGPTKTTYERLDPEAQRHFLGEMEQVYARANRSTSGGTEHEAEFLEVHARKR